MSQYTEFKQIEIGGVPEGWGVARLKDVVLKIDAGQTAPQGKDYFEKGEFPFVRVKHLDDLYQNKYVVNFDLINEKAVSENKLKLYPKGSIIFPKSGESIRLERRAILKKDSYVVNHLCVIIPDKEKVDDEFLFYHLAYIKISELLTQTTTPSINLSQIKEIKVPRPPRPEQRKIASILSTVDEAIQRTDEIIQKSQELKRGLMQRLLTRGIGHTRFKQTEIGEIPEEWEVVKLGDVAGFKNGINFSKEQKGREGVPTVDVLNMYGESIYLDLNNLYRVKISASNNDYLLKRGDILFVRSSLKREGAGWASLFNGWDESVTFCGFIIRARLNNKNIFPEFLTYFLRSDSARRELISGSGQVAVTNVSQDFLKTLKFPLPPLPEQRKIVSIFATVDEKIEKERQRKERLEKLKKGLMQDLLTGRVRVKA